MEKISSFLYDLLNANSNVFQIAKPFQLREPPDIRSLFNFEVASSIVREQYGDCWLARNGKLPALPELKSGSLTVEQMCSGITQGYSLVIRHAEYANKELSAIAEVFSAIFQKPIDIQLYFTPENCEGFDWHFDYEDVFVFQTFGVKEFTLRPNSFWPDVSGQMQSSLYLNEVFTTEIKFVLSAGEFLFIPAGWWHKAKAMTPSYHISVGVLTNDVRRPARIEQYL
ncbi:JmjC domain-containing protein [Bdellovibrio sp. HCB274]|uniref:JmjC domain-containing protein n=1 Tax=Bdellovibrio sp. HCB274 TaxID=3394361 RepID=UPI0039B4D689